MDWMLYNLCTIEGLASYAEASRWDVLLSSEPNEIRLKLIGFSCDKPILPPVGMAP